MKSVAVNPGGVGTNIFGDTMFGRWVKYLGGARFVLISPEESSLALLYVILEGESGYYSLDLKKKHAAIGTNFHLEMGN